MPLFPRSTGSRSATSTRKRLVQLGFACAGLTATSLLAALSPFAPIQSASSETTIPASSPAAVLAAAPSMAPKHTAPAVHHAAPAAHRPAAVVHTQTVPAVTRVATTARAFTTAAAPSTPSGYGCGPAIAYLSAHAAPGFRFECPAYSLGHQAMTCINVAGVCSGEKLITISDPCRAAYMNEASNSWVLEGLRSAPIDPYGYCG